MRRLRTPAGRVRVGLARLLVTRGAKGVLERLGPEALGRVLDDLLDQTRLARLAAACGLTYPGIRTRSQKRERILADLVDRAGSEDTARKAIYRTLKKETSAAQRSWSKLDAQEQRRRLGEEAYLLSDGHLGLHLFLLAASPAGAEEEEILRSLLARKDLRKSGARRSSRSASDVSATGLTKREIARLQKKNAELRKKAQHLESQLARSRDTEKAHKKDLIQRKGELAEARILVERLRKDLEESRGKTSGKAAAEGSGADAALETLVKAVRKLASEQRKLTHRVEKLSVAPPSPTALDEEALKPMVDAVAELDKETTALRRERKRALADQAQRLDEIRAEVRALKSGRAEPAPPRGRRKGEPERVGVFIDVQNVYYAARQLKGKLDFDALLQTAVRDRRLIRATAYMVESKEIDQSGFIAILQQLAIAVRRKTLKVRADGSMKGDWDMEMALDILDAAPNLDVVVLVSGDGDFTSLVKRVKSIGPRVEVVAFPRNTAKSLLEAADQFQPLDRNFMIRTSPRSRRRKSAKTRSSADRSPQPAGGGPADDSKGERTGREEKA